MKKKRAIVFATITTSPLDAKDFKCELDTLIGRTSRKVKDVEMQRIFNQVLKSYPEEKASK